jgi:transcriptional regulator with XRE-family HTH domain
MLSLGQTIQRWRLERGMSQAELARRAKLPRPNLSNLECGKGDPSLRTVRALALALDIRSGVLVDGQPPGEETWAPSRAALERVAGAAVRPQILSDPREQALADHLRTLLGPRLSAAGIHVTRPRRLVRRSQAAWLALAEHSPAVAQSLLQRAQEKAQFYERQAN